MKIEVDNNVWLMIATIIISCVTFILITLSILFFPHIQIKKVRLDTYWMIALLGALILLCTTLAPISDVWNQLTSNSAINPLKILILFFSMTILSIFLDEFGLFKYLAVLASKKAKGSQFALFFILYVLTSILTIFTSNDVVILTLTPFICFFCKNAKINPLPYLISEFVAANTWSTMFIIGNPTNIYLATSAGITFIEYLEVMTMPTIIAGITEIVILYMLFHKQLGQELSPSEETYHIESKFDLIVGVSHLAVCLIFLVISSYLNLEMWFISLICALSLLCFVIITRLATKKHWNYVSETVKRLPYQLIPFFLSMFVIVVALNMQGISSELGKILSNGSTVWVYGFSSFFASNIINNIPMSILFANLPVGLPASSYTEAIYSTIIGSNIGAFLTPIGALAGIMFSGLLYKHEVKFSFLDFVKYGAIISIPTISVELLMLSVII